MVDRLDDALSNILPVLQPRAWRMQLETNQADDQGTAQETMQQSIASNERRRTTRGTSPPEPSRSRLIDSIVGAYREMPGLILHVHQAARLFGMREPVCRVVLEDLVRDGQLRRSADGQYLMA
jgi:hypothetical protein